MSGQLAAGSGRAPAAGGPALASRACEWAVCEQATNTHTHCPPAAHPTLHGPPTRADVHDDAQAECVRAREREVQTRARWAHGGRACGGAAAEPKSERDAAAEKGAHRGLRGQ